MALVSAIAIILLGLGPRPVQIIRWISGVIVLVSDLSHLSEWNMTCWNRIEFTGMEYGPLIENGVNWNGMVSTGIE